MKGSKAAAARVRVRGNGKTTAAAPVGKMFYRSLYHERPMEIMTPVWYSSG